MINWEVILWSCITLAVIMGIIALVLSLVSARSMKKQREKVGGIHTAMQVGSEVMFAGGIYGKVTAMDEDIIWVEVSKNVILKVSRYAVQELIEP